MIINEKFQKHDTLNPKLWNDDFTLKQDVKERLMLIAKLYKEYMELPVEVIDACLVGSNASFNYTEFSDIDLHLVVNFETMEGSDELIQSLFNAKKTSFNSTYDITIKGIPVELYVEDVKANTASNGVYSLYTDSWVKFPKPIEVEDVDVSSMLPGYVERINGILAGDSIEDVKAMINELYIIRKYSIAVEGEYGFGNMLFKEIRKLGLLDALKEKNHELTSKQLSLESLGR